MHYDLGLWVKNLWPNLHQVLGSLRSFFFSVFPSQQRLVQDPHLVERNHHHDEKPYRHKGIARQHGEDE